MMLSMQRSQHGICYKNMRSLINSCCLVLLLSCAGEHQPPNKFSDPEFVRIKEWQDRRLTDSLVNSLGNAAGPYRHITVLAFGSVQDTLAVPLLEKILLEDKNPATRSNAAFALGQTGSLQSIEPLRMALLKETNSDVVLPILEALGKISGPDSIDNLISGTPEHTASYEGRAWFYYRLGLRHPIENIYPIADYLKNTYTEQTRLGAAHFFARNRNQSLTEVSELLIHSALNDPSDNVRMSSAASLRKINDTSAVLPVINKIVTTDRDYRTRINAIRSLIDFPFDQTNEILIIALQDSMVNVAIAAAEVIRSSINKEHARNILQKAREVNNWRVQALLYQATLSVSTEDAIVKEAIAHYKESDNPYQKAALLQALGNSITAHPFIRQQLMEQTTPVIQSSAAMALVAINRHKDFPTSLKNIFRDYLIEAVGTGDVAVIGVITDALMDSALHYKSIISDISFLYKAREKLSLPRDYESFVPLEKAIAYFENLQPPSVKKEFNHPIDWALVKRIQADQKAIIKTTKGEIVIHLLVEEAPGSVANFVELVQKKYYDSKFIHRVAPNFVVQGGCHRGDGWGSEDYSIRSEFSSRKYTTGSVGMASAGKDTEGTQWFITHSPTPHLDGRYTIFAEVEKGMEIVHRMEVGDSILSIRLDPELPN